MSNHAMTPLALALKLKDRMGVLLSEPREFRGEITVDLLDADVVAEVCAFAKGDLGFDYLVDITSIDNYGTDPRWTLVYHLYSYRHRASLRLKTNVSEELSEVFTVTGVWRTADWHEREIFDMMGIRFRGHPDLRRILMWDGYPHFPLRKDFPLAGKPSLMPEVAFSKPAPLDGGPFVTVPGRHTEEREPRVHVPDGPPVNLNAKPNLPPATAAAKEIK
jgi:NADH-quinone oxidoreductase subunit C